MVRQVGQEVDLTNRNFMNSFRDFLIQSICLFA